MTSAAVTSTHGGLSKAIDLIHGVLESALMAALREDLHRGDSSPQRHPNKGSASVQPEGTIRPSREGEDDVEGEIAVTIRGEVVTSTSGVRRSGTPGSAIPLGSQGESASTSASASDVRRTPRPDMHPVARGVADGTGKDTSPVQGSGGHRNDVASAPSFPGLQAAALSVLRSSRAIQQMCLKTQPATLSQTVSRQVEDGTDAENDEEEEGEEEGDKEASSHIAAEAAREVTAAAAAIRLAMADACMNVSGVSVLSPRLRGLYEDWFVPRETLAIHDFTR